MITTLVWSLIVTFALWLPVGNHIILFYFFAPLFGFGSGSIISMAPVCVGQLCKADEYGQFYGTSYSVVAFAYVDNLYPLYGKILIRFIELCSAYPSEVNFFRGLDLKRLLLSGEVFCFCLWLALLLQDGHA